MNDEVVILYIFFALEGERPMLCWMMDMWMQSRSRVLANRESPRVLSGLRPGFLDRTHG